MNRTLLNCQVFKKLMNIFKCTFLRHEIVAVIIIRGERNPRKINWDVLDN